MSKKKKFFKSKDIFKKINLLSIDASSHNLSFCLVKKGKVVFNYNRKIRFGATRLIGNIEKAMKKFKMNLSDIDAFSIGSGPGSFTGLRITFSILKAFALALKKPIIQVSSFFSCAYPFSKKSKKIAVITDARKGLVYAAYFVSKNGVIKSEGKVRLVKLEEAIKRKKDYLFVTYDSHLRKQAIDANKNLNFYSQDVYPKASGLLSFIYQSYIDKKFVPVEKLEPLYIHPKTCQIRSKK